jgi:hypothetical protein
MHGGFGMRTTRLAAVRRHARGREATLITRSRALPLRAVPK